MTRQHNLVVLAFVALFCLLVVPMASYGECVEPADDNPDEWADYDDCMADLERDAEEDAAQDEEDRLDRNADALQDAMQGTPADQLARAADAVPEAADAVAECAMECVDELMETGLECAGMATVCVAFSRYYNGRGSKYINAGACIATAAICATWAVTYTIVTLCDDRC